MASGQDRVLRCEDRPEKVGYLLKERVFRQFFMS